jgi:ABC-type glycerol-3-phosphate transport system permease component
MDVKEAAVIDGANNLAVMLYIVFPMTINMYMITFIGSIMAGWNDYMTMIVWMPSYPNLAYGVYQFSVSTETGLSWPPIQCAGAMLIMIPILIYYIFSVDRILGEITISTSK